MFKLGLDTKLHYAILRNVNTRSLELGKLIKSFRLERDMTQANMAAYLGISRATVNRLEQGKTPVRDLLYAKVRRKLDKAQALQVA